MDDKYKQIGQLGRSYGNQGNNRVKIYEDYTEILKDQSFVFIHHDSYFVPYRVVYLNLPKKLIRFDDIVTQEQADRIQNEAIYLPKDILEDEVGNWLEDWIGFVVEDQGKYIGEILKVEEVATQILATIKTQDRELYIPIHEDLIIELDLEAKKLNMDLPEGILDL